MTFSGLLIRLNEQREVEEILFSADFAKRTLRKTAESLQGVTLEQIPHFQLDPEKRTLVWEGCHFSCCELKEEKGSLLLLQEENVREQLLAEMLNHMPDALQLYDARGNIQFFNRTARQMMGLSLQDDVRGRTFWISFPLIPNTVRP